MSNTEIARYFALSQPKLRSFIRSMVFDPADVDDILQDVAVIAIENSDRFDSSQSVDGWVFGIARNRVFKHFEKHKRQKLCFSTEMVIALTKAAEKDTQSQDSFEALEGCLGKLKQSHRELLIRRHQPGTTARQLAQEIGYTDTRMSRLIQSLYAKLMKCVENRISGVTS